MCLYVKSERKIAEEDIPCYKIVKYYNGVAKSIFYNHVYEEGVTYEGELDYPVYSRISEGEVVVNEGFHSYASNNEKVIIVNGGAKYDHARMDCIIPQGSEYYEGEWRGVMSYASSKLKCVKIKHKRVAEATLEAVEFV